MCKPGHVSDAPVDRLYGLYGDVPLEIRVELDRVNVRLVDMMALTDNDVLVVAKPAGEPLDIFVGGIALGNGEVVTLSENRGVRITTFAVAGWAPAAPQTWSAGKDIAHFLKDAPAAFREGGSIPILEEMVCVQIVVGRIRLALEKILKLTNGSFLPLAGTSTDHPVEIVVDDKVLAFGEVVVVNGSYGIRAQMIGARGLPHLPHTPSARVSGAEVQGVAANATPVPEELPLA